MRSPRTVAVVVGVAAALVVSIAVVLQSSQLSVPPVRSCQPSPSATGVSPGGAGSPATLTAQASTQAIHTCLSQISSKQSSALVYGWIAALAVLALGVGVGAVVGRPPDRGRVREGTLSPGVRTNGAARRVPRDEQPAAAADMCARERAILASACIDVSDVVDSPALRERLLDALKATGVTPVEAGVGEPFDSSRHKAMGTIPTDDPRNNEVVAETQRPGYVDHGRRVRYPEVLVFKWSGGVSDDQR